MSTHQVFDALVVEITRGVTRFALGVGASNNAGKPVLGHYLKVSTDDFDGIQPLLDHYIDLHGGRAQMPAVLAISHAGPQIGERIIIPGCSLSFTIEELRSAYHDTFERIVHTNDCVAMGSALLWLGEKDVASVAGSAQQGFRHKAGRYGLVVPSYGLGVASIIHNGESIQVIDSEGGHSNFAPSCEWQTHMLLEAQQKGHSLSAGDLISYPGLERFYAHVAASSESAAADLRAQEILLYARNEADRNCVKAIRYFAKALGAMAGDVALMLGAVDGVFLVSPFVNEVVDFGPDMEAIIREEFEAKVDFSLYMQRIPLYMITHRRVSMIGILRIACEDPDTMSTAMRQAIIS